MKKTLGIVLLVLFAIGGYSGAHSAFAQTPADCDTVVVDGAGLFKGNFDKVTTEAVALTGAGATVRVRTVTSLGSYAKDPSGFLANMQKQCPSWQTNNLIALVVSSGDRQTGIYAGNGWNVKNSLDSAGRQSIIDKSINNLLPGDFAVAVASGLKAMNAKITNQLNPGVTISGAPVVNNNAATDLTGLWVVLGILAIAAILIGVIILIVRALRIRSQEKEARQTAQTAAVAAKLAAVNAVHANDELLADLEPLVASVAGQVSAQDAQSLMVKFKGAKDQVEKVSGDYANNTNTETDPEQKGLTVGQYEHIAGIFDSLTKEASEAAVLLREAEGEKNRLQALIVGLPKKVDGLTALRSQASARIQKVGDLGFTVTDALSGIEQGDDRAKMAGFVRDKCFTEAANLMDQLSAELTKIVAEVENLPVRKQTLLAAQAELISSGKAVEGRLPETKALFDDIAKGFAASQWDSVKGNGTESMKRLATAYQALASANDALEHQHWDDAENYQDSAKKALDEAAALLNSIVSLKTDLDFAKNSAPQEIAAAQADIDSARDFIKEHDPDIRESLETDLDNDVGILEQVRNELTKSQPDYLAVLKLAKSAHAKAEEILTDARSEFEQAESKRHQAISALNEADAAVAEAVHFIQNHHGDVKGSARSSLKEAQDSLEAAKRQQLQETDPDAVISSATQAETSAALALKEAKKDFKKAEAARDDNWGSFESGVIVGSSVGSSHHSSHHDDGGSSGSFGGFGGGGSSGGFGGFGGGGSSGGW